MMRTTSMHSFGASVVPRRPSFKETKDNYLEKLEERKRLAAEQAMELRKAAEEEVKALRRDSCEKRKKCLEIQREIANLERRLHASTGADAADNETRDALCLLRAQAKEYEEAEKRRALKFRQANGKYELACEYLRLETSEAFEKELREEFKGHKEHWMEQAYGELPSLTCARSDEQWSFPRDFARLHGDVLLFVRDVRKTICNWREGVLGRVMCADTTYTKGERQALGLKRKANDMLLPLPLGYGVVSAVRCQCHVVRASLEEAKMFLMGMVAEHSSDFVDRKHVERCMDSRKYADEMRLVNGCERFFVIASEESPAVWSGLCRSGAAGAGSSAAGAGPAAAGAEPSAAVAAAAAATLHYGECSKTWWSHLIDSDYIALQLLKSVEAGALGTSLMERLITVLNELILWLDMEHCKARSHVPDLEKHVYQAAGFNFETVKKPHHSLVVECLRESRSFVPRPWVRLQEFLPMAVVDACHTCEIGEEFLGLFKKYESVVGKKGRFHARKFASAFVGSELPRLHGFSDVPEFSNVEVFGVTEKLGSDSEPNHSFVVVHDIRKCAAHVLFSGQVFSNFCGSVRCAFKGMDVEDKNGRVVACLAHDCSEVYFQLAKAVHSGNYKEEKVVACMAGECSDEVYFQSKKLVNAEMVLQAEKPGAAKAATNRKNMPECAPTWDGVSSGVMLQAVLRKLQDPEFYEECVKVLEFCRDRLRVASEQVFFVENTDDGVWGCGSEIESGGSYALAAVQAIAEGRAWKGENRMSGVFKVVTEAVWDAKDRRAVPHDVVMEKLRSLPPAFKVVGKSSDAEAVEAANHAAASKSAIKDSLRAKAAAAAEAAAAAAAAAEAAAAQAAAAAAAAAAAEAAEAVLDEA